ncbi:hypothetical protein PG991_010754 [Apiospora marii]|uniref:MYND-type domain-containing protein n=1 Tax=Apiospora marii TaxID=335849 RepID=A0ABR1RC99_9PEZI
MSSTGSRTCIICEKPDAKRCGRCNGTYYCSQECQHQDWPVHKLLCASFGAFDISTRPTSEHFRAISFPQGGRKPKLVWIHCNWNKPDHTIFHFPVSDSVIGPGTHPEITPVQYNPVLNRRLDDTIRIAWRDKYLSDGSKPNKSLLSVTATRPGYSHDWRGPITAYGTVGTGTDQTRYRDLGMNDFRHLTDYFLSCGYEPLPASPEQPSPVKGVMVNCEGDQAAFNKPQFEAVDVSHSDPIFFDGDTSDVADRIGLPILARRCPASLEWSRCGTSHSPAFNQAATFLFMCCDTTAVSDLASGTLGWGWVSLRWQFGARSVLLVRQDKKPLWVLHAEALSKYCEFEILPLITQVLEQDQQDQSSKEVVTAKVCRSTFSTHWHKLLEGKTDEEKEGVPFPYDSDL